MAKLEEQMKGVNGKMDAMSTKLDQFIESADEKYATKLTEVIVYGMVGIILISVLYLLLRSIGIEK